MCPRFTLLREVWELLLPLCYLQLLLKSSLFYLFAAMSARISALMYPCLFPTLSSFSRISASVFRFSFMRICVVFALSYFCCEAYFTDSVVVFTSLSMILSFLLSLFEVPGCLCGSPALPHLFALSQFFQFSGQLNNAVQSDNTAAQCA